MTRKELQLVKEVLMKIKNPSALVNEAICNVERDIQRRMQQSKNQKDTIEHGYTTW